MRWCWLSGVVFAALLVLLARHRHCECRHCECCCSRKTAMLIVALLLLLHVALPRSLTPTMHIVVFMVFTSALLAWDRVLTPDVLTPSV